MEPHGWKVGFHQFPAIAQPTFGLFVLFVSLSDVHCLHALWIETLLQSFNVFYASRNCWILLKMNLYFYAF
jgi:hypothetical protein